LRNTPDEYNSAIEFVETGFVRERHGAVKEDLEAANAARVYEVSQDDLPLHCPMDGMYLWNSHPKVYLPIEQTGEAKCPYCSASYRLVSGQES
jgi:uncharacterized Zn-finger protein